MELMWIVYCIEVLTNIQMWGITHLLGMFVAVTFIYGLVSMIRADTDRDTYFAPLMKSYFDTVKKKSIVIPLLLVFGFGSLFNMFMPSKQTAYTMLAAYATQETFDSLSKNQDVQRVGKQTLSLVEKYIAKYEKELDMESKNKDSKAEDK